MKAMVLAAGLGTRLGALTHDRPKALVELEGHTLLEIVLARLGGFGVREVIVNVHHFANQIAAYLQAHDNFGMNIVLSREDDLLLDTGGGLKKAGWFFAQGAGVAADQPFVLHNVDVLSDIDLCAMAEAHQRNKALATLAVMARESSRHLLFDDQGKLCGRQIRGRETEISRQAAPMTPLAFCGVHVISPRLLPMITENGVFSIIETYLRLAATGGAIQAFRVDGNYWRDLGRPSDLEQAAADAKTRRLLP